MGEKKDPETFAKEHHFWMCLQQIVVVLALVFASVGSTADDGGESNIPFFFTGFPLGVIHALHYLSEKHFWGLLYSGGKGLTKKRMIDILQSDMCSSQLWPKLAWFGFIWCCAGIPLTVLGGTICKVEGNTTIENTCYYDVAGDKAPLYRSMAIGLIVLHVLSLIFFLLSSCPLHSFKDRVKDDPKPKPASSASKPANTNKPQGANPPAEAPKPAPTGAANGASGTSPLSAKDLQKTDTIVDIEKRLAELERQSEQVSSRERELERRELELRQSIQTGQYPPPPPPAYTVAIVDGSTIQQVKPQDKQSTA